MSDISSGLQFYSILKNGLGVIVLCIACICASYFYSVIISKNYIQANNSKITYKHFNNNVASQNCNSSQPASDCLYLDEYDDNNNNHYAIPTVYDNTHIPSVGNSNFYYEDKEHKNHVSSPTSPSNFVFIILAIVCVLLFFASINLYFVITNKSYGAVVGGIEATSDVFSVFNRRNN